MKYLNAATIGTLGLATTDYRRLDGRLLDWDETKGSPLSHRRGSRTVRSRADSRSRESADNADNAFG